LTTLAVQRDALMPRQPGGMGPGLLLALLIHAALVVALAFGVRWHASEPEGVEAELWAAVPQIAAPKAVEPEPPPVRPEPPKPQPVLQPVPKPEPVAVPDAQIAIEKAKREKLELQKKKEEEKELADKRRQQEEQRKKELEDKRKKDLETQKLAALREQNLKRMMGQAGATGEPNATGTATQSAGRSASYAGRIKARIKPNIAFADTVTGNPIATVKVRLAPDGTIVGKELVKSSGVPSWDDAVLRAVEKTEVLPRDTDGTVPASFEIDFRPRD
jgi:colicin import membrane protein